MKSSNQRIQYYVEGLCEKKLIRTLVDHQMLIPGKTEVLNPVQETLKPSHMRTLPPKTIIILVFDTDTQETDILKKNLDFLHSQSNVKNVMTVPQCNNLEQELIRCTDIRYIRELLGCAHDSDFKSLLIDEKRLFDKLLAHHFDFSKFWSSTPTETFLKLGIQNQGYLIKLK